LLQLGSQTLKINTNPIALNVFYVSSGVLDRRLGCLHRLTHSSLNVSLEGCLTRKKRLTHFG